MLISDVMTKGCTTCARTTSLQEAAIVMKKEDIGILPIAEDERLVGMITDRDIVIRGVAEDKVPHEARVSELMSDDVYYCFDDQLCEDVASNMAEMQVRRMPVVDRNKRLVGIVSIGDLAARGAPAKAKKALQGVSFDGPSQT
ncbi:MAG: CBS domain-containing protein [Alphaproteobacteria bacterium]|nr:CBS domain-containing protein [Alphaproteobacteria bacterium]